MLARRVVYWTVPASVPQFPTSRERAYCLNCPSRMLSADVFSAHSVWVVSVVARLKSPLKCLLICIFFFYSIFISYFEGSCRRCCDDVGSSCLFVFVRLDWRLHLKFFHHNHLDDFFSFHFIRRRAVAVQWSWLSTRLTDITGAVVLHSLDVCWACWSVMRAVLTAGCDLC